MVQFHRLWRELFIVVCMCFVAPVSTSAQGGIDIGQRISHLLPSGWNVTAYDFSPNNESIVYSVAGAMGPGELWRWSIPDKTPYLIASGIPTAANSKATPVFAYSLNGRSLVYSAVAPEGSSSIVTGLGVFSLDLGVVQGLITPDFDYYTSIAEFEPSPDGLWVIYTADSEIDEQFELYRVSLVTGQVAKLNLPLKPGGDVLTFAISHDNERLVYAADLAGDDVYQLYSVPLAGEASETKTLSNHEDGPRTVTSDFVITPAGNRVVFVSRLINNYDFTLFSVPIDGETLPVELSASDQEYAGYFDVSPDGETVVFVVNGGIYNGTDIYAVPTLGPANERIWLGQNAGFINYLDVVSNGHHVLWSMPSQQSGVSGLFAASIDGSEEAYQIGPQGEPDFVAFEGSRYVAYRGPGWSLVVKDLALPDSLSILDTSIGTSLIDRAYALTSNETYLVYIDGGSGWGVQIVPVSGPESASTRVDHLPLEGVALDVKLSRNDRYVAYRWSSPTHIDLFMTDLDSVLPHPISRTYLTVLNK